MTEEHDMVPADTEEPPPIFSSWSRWYTLVLGTLLVLIVLFYWFTKTFE